MGCNRAGIVRLTHKLIPDGKGRRVLNARTDVIRYAYLKHHEILIMRVV